MCQKRQILLRLGYKTVWPETGDWERLWRHFRISSFAKIRFLRHYFINNALLYHFLANWLGHRKRKMRNDKSVFREAGSPEKTSQSFSVSRFWFRGFCTPEEVKFDTFGNLYRWYFFAIHISTLRRFNRPKKILSYTLWWWMTVCCGYTQHTCVQLRNMSFLLPLS